ncbi:DNA mismatch repair protein MutS [Aminiphilus circumscriptus]|uniref:DNA mismatch repair protein MutS n=1 Tax=Aminiphilus circumscriptus TaxID=290732 RepID=UPI0004927853|nr:DNA mismatch repair protein MutS [Aminiphilus circumscriptus]
MRNGNAEDCDGAGRDTTPAEEEGFVTVRNGTECGEGSSLLRELSALSDAPSGGKIPVLPPDIKRTPMLEQYLFWKERYPGCLLFFRMGDFFELFFDDARTASAVLDITLTARDPEKKIPMAGVPFHAVESYLSKLVREGFSVALCDQVTEPDGRTLVERSVVRVVTPGTYVPEDPSGEGRLAALAPAGDGGIALALLAPGTGSLEAGTVSENEAASLLATFVPQEILLPRGTLERLPGRIREQIARVPQRLLARNHFDPAAGEERLAARFAVASLAAHGVLPGDAAAGCARVVLDYLEETHFSAARHVWRLRPLHSGLFLHLDVTTVRNLDLVEGDGLSLFAVLNRCSTPMGKRCLREWILRPLRSVEEIRKRQDAVASLTEDPALLRAVRDVLGACRDVERALGRLSLRVGTPRDLAAIRDTLAAFPGLVALCAAREVGKLLRAVPDLAPLAETLKTLADDPPRLVHAGGVIRDGADPELDEWRCVARGGEEWLRDYAARERELRGIKSLKVGYNKVFGYYIEISRANLENIPPEYSRKQTLVGGERFVTEELAVFEERMRSSSERIAARESALYEELIRVTLEAGSCVQELGRALAALDATASLADVAWERGYVRPLVTEGTRLALHGARHPVVEVALGNRSFTPNDVLLDGDGVRIAVVTGPNMAGKSTYLRMAALLILMAQMGSFVPAERAEVGLTDRIFTRIGARDELDRGLSTFMVEMVETAGILHNVTDRSFVVLDEIGRGTSTYDGMSIAWAVLEYLLTPCGARPKVLFATHFHELTALAERHREITNCSMAVEETAEGVTFLHRVVPRPADRSYGIEVARLAGIPETVLRRSRELLREFETRRVVPGGEGWAGAFPDGAAWPEASRAALGQGRGRMRQLSLLDAAKDAVLEELALLDPDSMTPLQALEVLYRLREKSRSALEEGAP